ncbi:MAG: prepilin-type N-terminal cleavage/methylation domain-containing protein [Fimbriimonadaceae bacterium]
MRRAFTLIELLVVIAIIAILAAILFPVFSQAKLAAKKTQGLSAAKQIGLGSQLYIADSDDRYFAYRFNGPSGVGCSGAHCINTDYQKLLAAQGAAVADEMFGIRSRDVIFAKQLIDPYVKSDDIWRAPTKPNAWVGYERTLTDTEQQFRSYGGQNSYGLNNYAFTPIAGSTITATQIEGPSDTVLMADTSYYNVLPANPCQLVGSSFNPQTSSYPRYWKNLGNSYLFRFQGGAANEPSDAEAMRLIQARYNGVLNVIRADSSAKGFPWQKVMNDAPAVGYTGSMWDPFKQGCQ